MLETPPRSQVPEFHTCIVKFVLLLKLGSNISTSINSAFNINVEAEISLLATESWLPRVTGLCADLFWFNDQQSERKCETRVFFVFLASPLNLLIIALILIKVI